MAYRVEDVDRFILLQPVPGVAAVVVVALVIVANIMLAREDGFVQDALGPHRDHLCSLGLFRHGFQTRPFKCGEGVEQQ